MLEILKFLRWQDILDILVVSFIIHQLILIIKGTRSVQMILGLVVLSAVYFMSIALDMAALQWLLKTFLSSLLLIVVIVFQHDIRMALTQVGKSPFQKNMASELYKEMLDMEMAKTTASGKGLGIGEAMYQQMKDKVVSHK